MSLQAADSRGLSHIYNSVCYSSLISLTISVTLTQLHRGRGRQRVRKQMQSRNREVGRLGEKLREKMRY